jgi:hypothetical protein
MPGQFEGGLNANLAVSLPEGDENKSSSLTE